MKTLYNIRKEKLNEDNNEYFYNFDETPIYFEMYSKTSISKVDPREINLTTFGIERIRIFLLLCIGPKGERLPPMLILKGKLNGNKEKKLQSHPLIVNKKY